MGNNIIELLNSNFEEINKLVSIGDYKNSYIKFKELYNQLVGVDKEEGINYLLSKVSDPNNRFLFSLIIGNLKKDDKIRYLLHLVYEQILVDSVDLDTDEDEKKNSIKTRILNDKQREKNNIVKKISKILEINRYITFIYFQSYLYELIAEKYYHLAKMNYSLFISENNDSLDDIQEIINQFYQCKDNYENSKNYKKLTDVYNKAYDKVIDHQKLLMAFNKYKEGHYNEALKYFNEIKFNDSKILEEKNYGINLCYEKLGEEEKENKNYEKALDYFIKSKNNFQIFQIKLLINEKKIINCKKEEKYEESFSYFVEIFNSYNTARISYDEKKYLEIFTVFIEFIIKLSLFYFEKKSLPKFKESIERTINIINNKEASIHIRELIKELDNIGLIEQSELYKYTINILLSKNLSEIKQRFYLSLLLVYFFKEKTIDILKMLLKENINLNYISADSFGVLKNFLKEIKIDNHIDEFFLLSKIIYKIVVSLSKFHKSDCLIIIGEKIKELNKNTNLTKINKLNDSMENLIYSFQEIMMNNKNIKSFEGHKNLLLSIFLKNNNFINCITNGLLFLTENKIIFEKKHLLKIKDYLIKNENGNILEFLLLQFKLQPTILCDDISIIYEILFFYQKINNSNEKQRKIFELLLTVNDEILGSKDSILNLEKYSKEGNLEPTFFKLIEKIPLEYRGIYLSQQLLNYKENKTKYKIKMDENNIKNQLSFKLYFQEEDLPLAEKNLDDPKILEKLIYSLKQQKHLFKKLNIENITKNFSSSKKELFNLLTENKVHFNERSLINLLQGFYKNNDNELKESFNVFNKIKEYENLSEIININLNVEEFLYRKEYLNIENFNDKLLTITNNFSYLFGFSSQHENYILYILELPSYANDKVIIDKMIELLLEKNFDIGIKIFKNIVKSISIEEFIELSKKILSNPNIKNNIKNLTLKYLYNIITKNKSKEHKNKIFSSFKFFIDRIKIPDILLEKLLLYLKNEEKDDIAYKEIIYFLGIYFSLAKHKQDKFLKEIIKIYENNTLYQFINDNIKSIKKENQIFYLFSNLYYYNFSMEEKNEEKIIQLPKKYLIDYIKSNFKELITANFEQNINYMEEYFKFDVFSPKRDEILRKLFFNGDKNAVNNLRLICH